MFGINELFEGICVSSYTNSKIYQWFYPPSQFALAVIGLFESKPRAVKESLEEIAEKPEFPFTKEIVARYGEIDFDVLRDRVISRFGTAKYITQPAVVEKELSAGGVLHVKVRRRGDSRGERDRTVVIPEALTNSSGVDFSCDCDIYERNFAKSGFYRADKIKTFVCCYHAASVMLNEGKAPFNIPENLAFEALLRAVGYEGIQGQKYFAIDDFLLGQDIISDEYKSRLREGNIRIQVLKHSKRVYPTAATIIKKMFGLLESKGYRFNGFAVDFRNSYQTTSPFFVRDDERSAHIIYGETTRVKILVPLLAMKMAEPWLPPEQETVGELEGEFIHNVGKWFRELDDKSRKPVATRLYLPTRSGELELNEQERDYVRRLSG